MERIWKDIEGFDKYEVSSFGEIRNKNTKRVKKQFISASGQQVIQLIGNEKLTTTIVAKLVARAFIDNPKGLNTVRYIDSNKLNTKADNLEWTDESNYKCRIEPKPVVQKDLQGNVIAVFPSMNQASRVTGIPQPEISFACAGWKNHCVHGYIWESK